MYNGIVLGDKCFSDADDCEMSFVGVKGTGNMGFAITGDRPVVRNLTLEQIGTGGLSIEGANAKVVDSTFSNIDLYAIGLEGASPEVSDVKISRVGTTSLGTGIIIYQKSKGFVVAESLFSSVRIGILYEVKAGAFVNNTFKNTYFKNVLYSSPWP